MFEHAKLLKKIEMQKYFHKLWAEKKKKPPWYSRGIIRLKWEMMYMRKWRNVWFWKKMDYFIDVIFGIASLL